MWGSVRDWWVSEVKRVELDFGMETVRPFRPAHEATSEAGAERVVVASEMFTADAAAVKSSA